jgi:hypothetical protein
MSAEHRRFKDSVYEQLARLASLAEVPAKPPAMERMLRIDAGRELAVQ